MVGVLSGDFTGVLVEILVGVVERTGTRACESRYARGEASDGLLSRQSSMLSVGFISQSTAHPIGLSNSDPDSDPDPGRQGVKDLADLPSSSFSERISPLCSENRSGSDSGSGRMGRCLRLKGKPQIARSSKVVSEPLLRVFLEQPISSLFSEAIDD